MISYFKINITNSILIQFRCACKASFIQKAPTLKQSSYFNKLFDKEKQKVKTNEREAISKGNPEQIICDNKGIHQTTITRRMRLLNKNFMSCISDVLSTGEINKVICDSGIRITQMNTTRKYNILQIYWSRSGTDLSLEDIQKRLYGLTGQINRAINDYNFMGKVPHIEFVYDTRELHIEEIESLLEKADMGSDFQQSDPTLFKTPYQVLTETTQNKKIKKSKESKQQTNTNENDTYSYLKMKKPDDMDMKTLDLNYEEMINIVLVNLKKSRAQHRSFNAVADPLPPPDWIKNQNVQNEHVYNTDERIEEMKKFLIENRKKRQRLARNARKDIILRQMLVDIEMNEAKDAYDSVQEDVQDFKDEDTENQ